MPSPAALSRLLVAVLLSALPQVGCSDEEPVPSGDRPVVVSPDDPSAADSVDDPTAPRVVSVVVADGSLTGDTGTVPLQRNVPVRLTVISDRAQTVLVEGYDLRALATAGVPVQLDFLVDRAGDFRVLLEESGLLLTTLSVS